MRAKFLKHTWVEMQVSIFTKIAAAETSFDSERILDLQFLPADDTTCSFLCSLNDERAVRIAKHLCLFLD